MASQVSLDLTGFSVSYNEYFRYSLCLQTEFISDKNLQGSFQLSGEHNLMRKVFWRCSGYLILTTLAPLRRRSSGRSCGASRASQTRTLRRWLRVRVNRVSKTRNNQINGKGSLRTEPVTRITWAYLKHKEAYFIKWTTSGEPLVELLTSHQDLK